MSGLRKGETGDVEMPPWRPRLLEANDGKVGRVRGKRMHWVTKMIQVGVLNNHHLVKPDKIFLLEKSKLGSVLIQYTGLG